MLISRIKRAIGVLGGKESAIERENRFFERFGVSATGRSLSSVTDFMNAYRTVAYIGQGCDKLAGYICRLEWKTLRKGSKRPQIVQDIVNLLDNINGLSVDYNTLVSMMTLHYILDGNIFLMLDYRSAWAKIHGVPDSIIPLNPALVDVYDSSGTLATSTTTNNVCTVGRYQVTYGGYLRDVPPSEIIHVKSVGPYNCVRGMGLVQQNAVKLNADKYRDAYNQNTFKNGGRFNSFLSHKGERPLGKEQTEDVKKQLKEQILGYENAGNIPLLPSNFEITSIDLNFKDMEILEQNRYSREDVMAILSIPPLAFGVTSDVKYDSASEQMKTFYEICIPRYTVPIELAFTKIGG
jgi:HK97 family phage portal protein